MPNTPTVAFVYACRHCGTEFELKDGYDADYCSEICWEADTDYGNE